MNLLLNTAIETKQAVLDSFGVATCLAEFQDGEIVIVAMNDLYRDVYGFSRVTRELTVNPKSLSIASGRPPEDMESIAINILANIARCMSSKIPTLAEYSISQRDGSVAWSRSTHTPIIEDGNVKSVLASSIDITETVEAQRKIEDNLNTLLEQHVHICGTCKNVESDAGKWQSLTEFVNARTDLDFSQEICSSCQASYKYRYMNQ